MKEEDKSKLAKKLSKAKDWKMVAMEKRKKKELNLMRYDRLTIEK